MDSGVLQPTGFQYRIIFADAGCIAPCLEKSLIKDERKHLQTSSLSQVVSQNTGERPGGRAVRAAGWTDGLWRPNTPGCHTGAKGIMSINSFAIVYDRVYFFWHMP